MQDSAATPSMPVSDHGPPWSVKAYLAIEGFTLVLSLVLIPIRLQAAGAPKEVFGRSSLAFVFGILGVTYLILAPLFWNLWKGGRRISWFVLLLINGYGVGQQILIQRQPLGSKFLVDWFVILLGAASLVLLVSPQTFLWASKRRKTVQLTS